jgi:hypothetical protein
MKVMFEIDRETVSGRERIIGWFVVIGITGPDRGFPSLNVPVFFIHV